MLRVALAAPDRMEWPRALEAVLGERRPKHLLGVGQPPRALAGELEARGCLIGTVPAVAGALLVLRDTCFDAVLVRPEAEQGLALTLVQALKLNRPFPGLSEAFLEALRTQVAALPFFVLPPPGEQEWALVLSARFVLVRGEAEVPIVEAINRLKRLAVTPAPRC
jgi:hypothetical protein